MYLQGIILAQHAQGPKCDPYTHQVTKLKKWVFLLFVVWFLKQGWGTHSVDQAGLKLTEFCLPEYWN